MSEVKKSDGEFIEIQLEDFKKLLLCARTCKDDYFIMKNLLEMKPIEDSAKQCRERIVFREPIFKVLKKFRGFKL